MAEFDYDEEHLAEISLLGELVDLACTDDANRLTAQELDEVFGHRSGGLTPQQRVAPTDEA